MTESVPVQSKSSELSAATASPRTFSLCMVSDDFLPGKTGVGIHVQCIARELVRQGHRVCVITTRRKGQPEVEVWHGIKIYRTFSVKIYGLYQGLATVSRIQTILKDNEVDIIHHHYLGFLLIQAHKAAQTLPVKQVYTYHMPVEVVTHRLLMRPFRGLVFRLHVNLCNRFDLILAPSHGLLEQTGKIGIDTPTHFLSNPVMLAPPADVIPPGDKKTFDVLYVGRLSLEKNIPYLIKAFSALIKANERCRLWIVGEGDRKGALLKLCETLGIMRHVRFVGYVNHDNLAQYYAAADVFVLPSLLETQGIVAMEAMRFAKPVIVTNRIVAARELVDEGVNGFIVDPDNVDDLSSKLILLCENPKLCSEMGKKSLEKSESFQPKRIVERLEQYYLGLF